MGQEKQNSNSLKRYEINDLRKLSKCKAITKEKNLWKQLLKNPLNRGILTLGNSFHYMLDFRDFSIPFISENVKSVTGYSPGEWKREGFEHTFKVMHPDDGASLKPIHKEYFAHSKKIPLKEKSNYRYTFDIRLKHANGHHIRILNHAVFLLFDDDGQPLFCFNIATDISQIKKTTELISTISKYNPKTKSYITKESKIIYKNTNFILTPRQTEILGLIASGATNGDIGKKLSISEATVRDHRKNMLKQNNLKSTAELIKIAASSGLIAV